MPVFTAPLARALLTIPHTIGLSPIHGLGVFAKEIIPKGTVVCKFIQGIDYCITENEIANLPAYAKEFLDMYSYKNINTGKQVVCGDNDRFMNHSRQPNIVNDPKGFDDECRMVTERDILPGEELTCDYETFDLDFPSYGHLFSEAQHALQTPTSRQGLFQCSLIGKLNVRTHRKTVR